MKAAKERWKREKKRRVIIRFMGNAIVKKFWGGFEKVYVDVKERREREEKRRERKRRN